MSEQNDITAFSGFGSWMSTFTPQENEEQKGRIEPHIYNPGRDNSAFIFELPADNVHSSKELEANLPRDTTSASKPKLPEDPPRPQPAPVHASQKNTVERPQIFYHKMQEPMSTIQIHCLQQIGAPAKFVDAVSLSSYDLLSQLNAKIQKKGYTSPVAYLNQANICLPTSTPVNETSCEPWRVLVTTDKSNYDPTEGLRIHIDEPFTTFLSRVQMSVKCINSKISVNNGDLRIGFHRTLRVPEDGRMHLLPADFGLFPTQNLAAYSKKLLASNNPSLVDMAKKSGVFFPIFQREALWLSFESPKGSEYAIRVFVGGINVVSGRKWDAPVGRDDKKQDYIIVPHQKHLDGITVGNGVVRQFIAMPIGSGYSIEKQMTGKEDVGGVQLEITPTSKKFRFTFGNGEEIFHEHASDAETRTPRHYSFTPGQDIFMEREGVGTTWIGGQQPTSQRRLLRELLLPSPNGVQVLTAIYNIKLHITVHGRLRKHVVETAEFSPFTKLSEVAKRTNYKGMNLQSYDFFDRNGTMLSRYSTLVINNLHVDGMVVARKSSTNHAAAEDDSPMYCSTPPKPASYPIQTMPTYGPSQTHGVSARPPSFSPAAGSFSDPQQAPPTQSMQYAPGPSSGYAAELPTMNLSPTGPAFAVSEASEVPSKQWNDTPPSHAYSAPAQQSYVAPVQQAFSHSDLAAGYGPPTAVNSAPAQQSHSAPTPPSYAVPPPQINAASPPQMNATLPPQAYAAPPLQVYVTPSPQAYAAPPPQMNAAPTPPSYATPPPQAYAAPPTQAYAVPPPQMNAAPPAAIPEYSPAPESSNFAPASEGRQSHAFNPDSLPAHSAPDNEMNAPPSTSSTPTLVASPRTSISSPSPAAAVAHPPRKPSPPAPQSWAMNLAPGGLIKQEIRQDNDIYRELSLNKPATVLLSIQLLNSVAYEAITGMTCPPTPITMADYIKASIPWFDNYKGQTAATDGAVNFSRIRSVAEMDAYKGVDVGASVAESQNVACTVCRRNFCDCVLRPCNHAFCAACVRGTMCRQDWRTGQVWVECKVCGRVAADMLGFSAPMALPRMEDYPPDLDAKVVVLAGGLEKNVFELA